MADDIFELPLTAAAAELLAEAAHTMSRWHASTVFTRFVATASQSKEEFEAAFLAAQMLRDLAVINRMEAAYAFQSLIAQPLGAGDRKSTRLNSSHVSLSRMPSSA